MPLTVMPFDSLSRLPEMTFSKGEEIIECGDHPEKLVFLKNGEVDVTTDGMKRTEEDQSMVLTMGEDGFVQFA